MTELSRMFREDRFDITEAYTSTTEAFDRGSFARSLLGLLRADYDELSELMRVENAPLLTEGDEMVDSDDVLAVDKVGGEVDGMKNVAVVTLKQKNEDGEHKKFVVSGEMTPTAYRNYCAMEDGSKSDDLKTSSQKDKIEADDYTLIESLDAYEDMVASADGIRIVFGPKGEFGKDLLRFYQANDKGELLHLGFVSRKLTPDAFEQAEQDQAYFAEHGSLDVD